MRCTPVCVGVSEPKNLGDMPSVSMEDRFIEQLNVKIEQGSFYDAHQLCRAIFDRFGRRKDVNGGLDFGMSYGELFASKEKHELTVNLGLRTLQLLKDNDVKASDLYLEKLATFFILCPAHSTDGKYEFMNNLIGWSKTIYPDGSPFLRSIIADAYLAEGKYGACQGHIVYCDDADAMAILVREWKVKGYPLEQDFFALRLICILLSRTRVDVAGKLLEKLELPEVPQPPLQLAWLLWAACFERNLALLEVVQRKYALIIRVDPTFEKLLSAIQSDLFGIKPQQNGMMAILQKMMGGQ